ncbi:MAG: HAD-IA family hydrolase, partial [Gammaproteobacteria bacterium]|nr:HAD-IA family hydrolase [Gammaproteobacteria bacterium]
FQKTDSTQNLIKELHQSKTRHYTELLATGTIPLRTGVKRLLKEALDNNLRIAIATTTTPENVTALLEHALEPGSTEWFDVIAAGDIVPAKKPAPDIYTYALEKMKLPASACLAFEDSENGIRSSMGADLKTLITINDYTKDHDFTGAAIVLSDLGEPDNKFTTIAGDDHGFNFVNIDMLKVIHGH